MAADGMWCPQDAAGLPESIQARFHRRWQHLRDPHVRALAWLLDAPDLLDPSAAQWHGKIATLECDPAAVFDWLTGLDGAPAALHAALDLHAATRLGRYAEKLMAWYFSWNGNLVAHGLQVQASRNETVGEFDFLLRDDAVGTVGTEDTVDSAGMTSTKDAGLLHWEFATKFYLFESPAMVPAADHFVGPNLADTLGAKMVKILDRQLALGQHPAAQRYLPHPVSRAQALVKGWLFYHVDAGMPAPSLGVSAAHCRGFWCTLEEFHHLDGNGAGFTILPRLAWLAPARVPSASLLDHAAMAAQLRTHFAGDAMPVMIARFDPAANSAEWVSETTRGFVVPDDWRSRAGDRIQRAVLQPDQRQASAEHT